MCKIHFTQIIAAFCLQKDHLVNFAQKKARLKDGLQYFDYLILLKGCLPVSHSSFFYTLLSRYLQVKHGTNCYLWKYLGIILVSVIRIVFMHTQYFYWVPTLSCTYKIATMYEFYVGSFMCVTIKFHKLDAYVGNKMLLNKFLGSLWELLFSFECIYLWNFLLQPLKDLATLSIWIICQSIGNAVLLHEMQYLELAIHSSNFECIQVI